MSADTTPRDTGSWVWSSQHEGTGRALVGRQALVHRLPLRDFDVEMTLPRDLTAAEAKRLCELIRCLAVDEPTVPVKQETP